MVTSTSSHHPKLPLSPSCPPGLAGSPEPLPSCDSSAAPEPGLCKEHRQRHQNGVKPDGKVLVSSRPCLPRVTSALACAVIFSCAFLVPELEGAQFRVLGPDQPVTAVVGEDVVLPCLLSPRLNAKNMDVLWFWSTSSIHVHYHHSGCDDYSFQHPQYRGRTELSKEGLSVGDVSLRILSARLSDEGQYRCLVQDGDSYEEASVELQVAVSGSSPLLSVEDAQDGGVRVRCRATGWYPKPEMVWRDVQGQQLPPVTQSDSQDQNGLFEVEKSIVIQRNAEQNVSCSVRNTRLPQEKEAPIYISDSIFLKEFTWKVAFFVTLAACFASLVVICLLIPWLRAQQATQIGKRDAEIRWRNTIFPVEEVHVTLDADTAHPQLILSDGGKSVRRGDMRQEVPDNPERYDTDRCVLGQEGFTSGRYFWDVDVGMEEGGIWALGVAKESTERKGEIDRDPRNGIWAIGHWWGEYWAQTSPERTVLSLTKRPRMIRVSLDTEAQEVAFFNADNQDLLYTFQLGPLSGERIRPWFWVYLSAQLTLKSPPSPPPVPSEEEPLLPSCTPLPTLPTGRRAPRTPTAGHDQDGEIHAAVHEQP
ncbi:butyrophilin subfamily 1 member A1-like isoform X4 [Phalacrocorax aristotelis]|uniref:butyrophilin subfamily 1 member A1-like isoform X4 n=1 Tax=Phalacrocorax aristotelis TaxID=126867 RepID=UPI003F4C5EEB